MEKAQQETIILWLKRVAAIITIIVWGYLMAIFLKDPTPFAEPTPYYTGSALLIFAVLTGVFKGLEYWKQQISM